MSRPVYIVLVLGLLTLMGFSMIALNRRSEPIEQPLAFNHRIHVEEYGLECIFCHKQVETHQRASLPTVQTCGECHVEAITGTAAEEKLLEFMAEDQPIPWKAIYRVPDHVYFSHRRHVTLGNVSCDTCHGQVPTLQEPPPRPLMSNSMEFCMDCHQEHNVTNDCLACHR